MGIKHHLHCALFKNKLSVTCRMFRLQRPGQISYIHTSYPRHRQRPEHKVLTRSDIMSCLDGPDLGLRGLSYWHWHLRVKNDPHFCGHGTVSTPPDLGAHSISWCIAPPHDYATLSGAEEEMFRETDVPVSDGAALPSLSPSVSPRWLVNYHHDVTCRPPLHPPRPKLTGPGSEMRSCICYGGDAPLASFALAEWKSNGLMPKQSW